MFNFVVFNANKRRKHTDREKQNGEKIEKKRNN